MSALSFGSGTIIGRRTDISNPNPIFMGVAQDVQVDFDQTLKDLIGQYKVAVDVAPAQLKISGKIKQARIQAGMVNDLLIGQTLTTGAGFAMAVSEAFTLTSTTNTVAHAATFSEDLGVFYALTGKQFTRVASAPTTGQYSVVETTGVYTFAAGDNNAQILTYYSYGVTTAQQLTINNTLMGQGATFEMMLQNTYTSANGVANNVFLKLFACKSSKLSMPFKNTDYTILEIDFQAFANVAGNVGIWASTE